MAGSRTKDISGTQSYFTPELVLLVDKIDTGSGDWLQARKIALKYLGNAYLQGSVNGINWHDEINVTQDDFIRISTDGGNTFVTLHTGLVAEDTSHLYFTEARVLATPGVQDAVDNEHTHTNKDILDNIVDSGDGTNFLTDDGTYKNASAISSPVTTKGDLYTFSTTDDRLPVGTNGQILTADSSEATGLKWASAGAGDMLAATYDPTSVVGDAFDMDNMVQGSTNYFVTSSDITNLGNLSGTNSGDQNAGDFNHDDLANITGTVGEYNHPTDAQMVVIGNTSGTNTGDQDLSDYFDTTADTLDDIDDGATYGRATLTQLGYIDQDVTSGSSPTFDGANFTGIPATGVELLELGTATYDDVQDWSNTTQSAGVISGGVITDGGSGTIDISSITGIVKTTNSTIGENRFFNLTGVSGQTLTDNNTNYIAVDYNSGTPQFVVGTSNTANGHTIFNLGKVYREGTTVDIIDSGLNIYDFQKRVQQHHVEKDTIEFVSGAVVSETGTRNIAITAGVMYAGLNRIATDAIDTSVADDFEYYYYTGAAWTESDETQINNTQYNNIATGLATLSNNQYGVHWVYKGTGTSTYVIYGQESYTLAGAQDAQPPTTLPTHVADFGVLRAKIIIEKSASTFTDIESVVDISFSKGAAGNHNELSGLQGGAAGEYYHLTSAQATVVGNTSGTNTGDQSSGDFDHNSLTNTHNLTTDIDHDSLTNTHNLTTDIDHDQLTNYDADEHFTQASISISASQVSDFDTEVSNNTDVDANTSARHSAITLTGSYDYLSLLGQEITINQIDYTTDINNIPTEFLPSDHGSAHISSGTDEIDGDKLDIDYTPSNYTPSTTPAEADDVDNLTAHLYGIDQALGSGSGDTLVYNEVPSGSINDSNTDFILANTPVANSERVYLNGLRQVPTSDYTISTDTITFLLAPYTGSTLIVDYNY